MKWHLFIVIVLLCSCVAIAESEHAGILNQLFGTEPRTETVSLGSGRVVGSTGSAVMPSVSLEPRQNEEPIDVIVDDSAPQEESVEDNPTDVESIEESTEETSNTLSRSSSTVSEEVLALIKEELDDFPEDITEEDIRSIIRDEIALQELYVPSSSTGTVVVAILLTLAGGAGIRYYFLKGKKPSIPSIAPVSTVPPQLTNYINQNKHFGKVALRKSLASSGWDIKHIQLALKEAGF